MTTYEKAGVNIKAGEELVSRLKRHCPEIGGFGGLYPLGEQFLVAGTDGVGTKLKLAFTQNRHDTIGIDLVAMCVNDVITTGATPLFFLDYFATSKLDVDQAEKVLLGVIEGCRQAGMILLGGETAEMPGFYHEGEYDLSGFAVGIVDKKRVIDGKTIAEGDLVLGLPSSGLHSNGFSLVRKILEESKTPPPADLLTPTTIYVEAIRSLQKIATLKGIAHITGGGLTENIPRILPEGLAVTLNQGSWNIPALFGWLMSEGDVSLEEMFCTFNMGIGMVLIVAKDEAKKICESFPSTTIIGEVTKGKGVLCH